MGHQEHGGSVECRETNAQLRLGGWCREMEDVPGCPCGHGGVNKLGLVRDAAQLGGHGKGRGRMEQDG